MEDLNKYRGNSHASRDEPAPKVRKPVERVISTPPTRRKRSAWSKMRILFTGGDAHEVGNHLLADVIVPSVQDLLYDIVTEGAGRSIYQDGRRGLSRVSGGRPTGAHATPAQSTTGGTTAFARKRSRGSLTAVSGRHTTSPASRFETLGRLRSLPIAFLSNSMSTALRR